MQVNHLTRAVNKNMVNNRYQYMLDFYKKDGTSVGRVPVSVDWIPLLEWTWWVGLRRNLLHATDGTQASTIEPVWNSETGAPYIERIRITILSEDADGISEEFSSNYFSSLANTASAALVKAERVKKDENVLYIATAFHNPGHAAAGPKPLFKIKESVPLLPIKETLLEPFTAASQKTGESHQEDMPVFIPERVLEQTRELGRQAGEKETGGVLIGHLHRDREVPEVFAEVTAQLPAEHTVSTLQSLNFTPQTWIAAREATARRRRGEILLGWYHSHPIRHWCKKCPDEKKQSCPLAHDFFSVSDRQLHRTVFPRSYTLALVLNDVSTEETTHSLFGWRNGILEPRGFHLMNGSRKVLKTSKPRRR